MPLGILWRDNPEFRVYAETRLYDILNHSIGDKPFKLLLLAPIDPLLYYQSLTHRLEQSIKYDKSGCPDVSQADIGAWYLCKPVIKSRNDNASIHECIEFKHLKGVPPPYSRSMGCFVELLVIYTKIRAGVEIPLELKPYVNGLLWCISRSSPYNRELYNISKNIVNYINKFSVHQQQE